MRSYRVPCAVYWVHSRSATDPTRHGYIGISRRGVGARLADHRAERIPPHWRCRYLYVGSHIDCRLLEFMLRPHRNIGKNVHAGGGKRMSARLRTRYRRIAEALS